MSNQFKFYTPIDVRISDINYGGHLSNDRYLSIFHDARIRYLQQHGFSELNIGNNVGLIMTEAHVHYYAEVFWGDKLSVGVCICEIGKIKFTIEYEMKRAADDKIVATGFTRMAGYDYQLKEAVKIPDIFKDKIMRFEENLKIK